MCCEKWWGVRRDCHKAIIFCSYEKMLRRHLLVLLLLSLTQITGWGVVGVVPVIATQVAPLSLCQ